MGKRILVHALIIAGTDGKFLISIIRNPELDEALLTGFISALSMFGSAALGQIDDITISGLDLHLIVVRKWGLLCIGIIDSDLPSLNFRNGCEAALDAFNKKYISELEYWDGSLKVFSDFKLFLEGQIQGYFARLKDYKNTYQSFFDASKEDKKKINPEDIIQALKKDVLLYQSANEDLHNKIKKLEEENRQLKQNVNLFEELKGKNKKKKRFKEPL